MNRRNFLALIGASVPGVWLNGVGLIQLPKKMVISVSGHCSFCGKQAKDVFGLAGVVSRPARICNECIDICFKILLDDLQTFLAAAPPSLEPPPPFPSEQIEQTDVEISVDFQSVELIRYITVPQSRADWKGYIDHLRRLLDQSETNTEPRKKGDELLCSFCDLRQNEVKKMIAGPRTHICDFCVGDAAALISMHC